jgi:murein tripeptide amidase MpaA
MLTVTSTEVKKRNLRKGVVIIARQHPGETGGSYMMQGLIDFITGSTPEAEALRAMAIFKVVPMLNPDGVIHGNYRTSLVGCDLNRRWKKPKRVFYIKNYHLKLNINICNFSLILQLFYAFFYMI